MTLPVSSEDLLSRAGVACEAAASVFAQFAVGPSIVEKKKELQAKNQSLLDSKISSNEKVSREMCEQVVAETFEDIEKLVRADKFGSFEDFVVLSDEKRKACITKSSSLGPLSVKVDEWLQDKLRPTERNMRLKFKITELEIAAREAQLENDKTQQELAAKFEEQKKRYLEEQLELKSNLELQRRLNEETERRIKETEAQTEAIKKDHEREIKELRENNQKDMADMQEEMLRQFETTRRKLREEQEDANRAHRHTLENMRQEVRFCEWGS